VHAVLICYCGANIKQKEKWGREDQQFAGEKDRIQNQGKLEQGKVYRGDISSYVMCGVLGAQERWNK
jgi:hypothetical protein